MTSPTYSLIKVKDVRNGVIVLENGSLRAVLAVTGLNYSLLSEEEQNLVISQFKNFLDGLDFQVEILVLSRLENINNHLKILHLRLEEEKEALIRFQLEEYISFLEDYLNNHKVMKKIFYIVVPYDVLEVSLPGGKETDESLKPKIEQLETRLSYVIEMLSSIGLHVQRLNDREILELLFEAYNPNERWGQIPKQIIEKLAELI